MAGASSRGPAGRTGTPPHTKDGTTPKILSPVPGSVCVQPAAFAGVDTEPPPVGSMDFIRLWTYRGKPVVYEYRNGARVNQLTYPNKDGRPFYQVDDFVLVSEIEKSSAEKIFPELQEPDEGGTSRSGNERPGFRSQTGARKSHRCRNRWLCFHSDKEG